LIILIEKFINKEKAPLQKGKGRTQREDQHPKAKGRKKHPSESQTYVPNPSLSCMKREDNPEKEGTRLNPKPTSLTPRCGEGLERLPEILDAREATSTRPHLIS